LEIICIVDKSENGNYFVKFENEELIFSLLTDEFMEVINKMFKINNDLTLQGLGELTKKGNQFREEVLDKTQYYNIISSDLFIFIYQWFTSIPLHHLNEVLKDKNGIRREQLCSKKLIVMNGKKQVKVTTRAGGRHRPYLIFKGWLQNYYDTGTMTFTDLIYNGVPVTNKKTNPEENTNSLVIENNIIKDDLIKNNKIINNHQNYNYYDIVHECSIKDINYLKYMPYAEYLKTDHWKNVKKKVFIRVGNKCQLCSSKINLNVHHNTYENRGEERYEDLIVLCQKCHEIFHFNNNSIKNII